MDKKKLPFEYPRCACGCNLSNKKADVAGMRGTIPMGYCPQCSRPQRLAEPKPEPEPVAEVKPEAEPAPEPKSEAPAEAPEPEE